MNRAKRIKEAEVEACIARERAVFEREDRERGKR